MADPPRRVGRPPLATGSPAVPVCLKLTPTQYDAAYRVARARGETVPQVIRRGLARLLHDDQSPR